MIGIALNIAQSTTNESFDIQSLSNWASVIGFIISILTFIWATVVNNRVSKLNRYYAFHLSMKSHIDVISGQLSNLKSLLRTPESNVVEIRETLITISEQLNSLKSKLSFSERKRLKRLNYFIRKKLDKKLIIGSDRKRFFVQPNFFFPGLFKFIQEDCWHIYDYSQRILNNLVNLKNDHDLKITKL